MSSTKEQLALLLEVMNIPKGRSDLGDEANLRWLGRNLMLGNQGHPSLGAALTLLRQVMEEDNIHRPLIIEPSGETAEAR